MEPTRVIGDCALYLADCRNVLPHLPKVDAVITDPPYGIGADKANAHSSIRDSDNWDSFGWDESRPDEETIKAIVGAGKTAIIWGVIISPIFFLRQCGG